MSRNVKCTQKELVGIVKTFHCIFTVKEKSQKSHENANRCKCYVLGKMSSEQKPSLPRMEETGIEKLSECREVKPLLTAHRLGCPIRGALTGTSL